MKRRILVKRKVREGWELLPQSDNFLFEGIDKILGKDGEEGRWIREILKV